MRLSNMSSRWNGLAVLLAAATAVAGSAPAFGFADRCEIGELTVGEFETGTVLEIASVTNQDANAPLQLFRVIETRQNTLFTEFHIGPRDAALAPEARQFGGRFGQLGGLLRVDQGRRASMGNYRTREYEDDALDQIAALSPGQTISIASSEHSRIDGNYRIVDTPVSVTFLGCGTRDIMDETHDLLLFDIEYQVRSYNRRTGVDSEITINNQIEYSRQLGTTVGTQDARGRTEVVAIHRP